MKVVASVSLREWRDLLELWKEGGLTDVLMTPGRISAYAGKELLYSEEFAEELINSFVSETIPADYEQVWNREILSGELFKYSFVSGSSLVRATLWNGGLHLRFLPVGSICDCPDRELERDKFCILHRGHAGAGKTYTIIKHVGFLSSKEDRKIFIYSDVQEVYIPSSKAHLVYIDRRNVRDLRAFCNLAKCADVVVLQSLSDEECDSVWRLYEEGVSLIIEGNPREYPDYVKAINHVRR